MLQAMGVGVQCPGEFNTYYNAQASVYAVTYIGIESKHKGGHRERQPVPCESGFDA